MTQTWNKQPGPAGPLLVCKWGCDRTGRTARGHTGGHSRVQAHALVPSGLVLGVSSLSSLALSVFTKYKQAHQASQRRPRTACGFSSGLCFQGLTHLSRH